MLQGPLNAFVTGPSHSGGASPDAVRIFSVTLIGATPHNLHKLLLTLGFIAIAWIFAWLLRQFLKLFIGTRSGTRFGEIDPRVFWRITEDWIELTLRFLGPDHGIRKIKDRMTRMIIAGFEKENILIAATRQEGVTLEPSKRSRSRA